MHGQMHMLDRLAGDLDDESSPMVSEWFRSSVARLVLDEFKDAPW
jgi:hypothetical protein